MKKVILLITAVAFAFTVNAQSIGVKVGASIANMKSEYDAFGQTIEMDGDSKVGVLVGVFADVPVGSSFAIHTGLDFIQKGYKYDYDDGSISYEQKTKVSYLQVPIRAAYNIEAGSLGIFVEAGPYLGYAISGKYEAGDEEADIEFGSGEEEMKPFEIGASLGAGIKAGKLRAALNYDFGLSNLSNEDDVTTKNKTFVISLGYAIF